MDFVWSFLWHLLFIVCFDTCWLTLNFKCLSDDFIYPKQTSKRSLPVTILFCFMCWIVSALYLAGHLHDTELDTVFESAWTGSLVYSVFNFTTYAMNSDWRIWPTAIVDTFWGTCLFTVTAVIVHKINLSD